MNPAQLLSCLAAASPRLAGSHDLHRGGLRDSRAGGTYLVPKNDQFFFWRILGESDITGYNAVIT
jgi:hypothetical protein